VGGDTGHFRAFAAGHYKVFLNADAGQEEDGQFCLFLTTEAAARNFFPIGTFFKSVIDRGPAESVAVGYFE